jgi:hypothetical protein
MIWAMALGRLILPAFRQEIIGLQAQAVLAIPDLNPALIPILGGTNVGDAALADKGAKGMHPGRVRLTACLNPAALSRGAW